MLALDIKKRRFIIAGLTKMTLMAVGTSILSKISSREVFVVTSIVRLPKALTNPNPEAWQFYRNMGLKEVEQMTRVLRQARNQGLILSRETEVKNQRELIITTTWRSYEDFKKYSANPNLISALSLIQNRVQVKTLV